MANPSDAPSVPYPTSFDDLGESQSQTVKAASGLALRRIADAVKTLKAAQQRAVREVTMHFKITDLSVGSKQDLQTIIGNYNRIAGALLGHENLGFEGETSGPAGRIGECLSGRFATAYVWGNTPPDVGDAGIVHLVSHRVFGKPLKDQARIVIHEVGHKFAGLDDNGNYDGTQKINISRRDAIVNADTYANFAIPADLPDPRRGL